jgi:hypothetical protein
VSAKIAKHASALAPASTARRRAHARILFLSCLILVFLATLARIARVDALPRPPAAANASNSSAFATAKAEASAISAGPGDIGGVVTSAKGPEAGVWVIAEQENSPTKFAKIVVTDDHGRYLVPDLPKGSYKLWVRGYGLVDSQPAESAPGSTLALTAVVAPDAHAAAQYYPADYWLSLMKIPTKADFPMTVPPPPPIPGAPDTVKLTHTTSRPGDAPPPPVIQTQADWLYILKGGCETCHQMGSKPTREIPAGLGTFASSSQAWERLISSGQVGRGMMTNLNHFGHDRGLAMFADWGDRIAAGELPPVPPRPEGIDRNVVITMWNWSVPTAFLHAMISTSKQKPTVNAGGPVYGSDWSGNCSETMKRMTCLAGLDPKTNESFLIPVPLPNEKDRALMISYSPQSQLAPSPYWGNELPWDDPINPGPITMDSTGRVWFNVETRPDNPAYCKAGSDNLYAKHSPRDQGGKGVDVYDPKTGKFGFVDLCFQSTRITFSDDKDNTLYFSVQRDGGIGWLNTRLWDQTHDAEKSQGWCPAVVDHNGDGKIDAYTKGPEPVDPELDREVYRPGAYGVAYNPVDGSVWFSSIADQMPGRLIRMVKGSNPPSTCLTEVYEVPYDPKVVGKGASHDRGMDIDSNGVVWASLTGEGYLASFDRRKCKVLPVGKGATTDAALTGKQCYEGWTLYPIPGPTFQSDPSVKSDYYYYMYIDRYNSLGLGNNVVIVDGANSDSLIAFQQDTKRFIRMTVPYRMGFFSRFFDARVDDPNAGWKGRGAWAANQTRGSWLTEGGKGTPSQLYHFQIRPDPLAK